MSRFPEDFLNLVRALHRPHLARFSDALAVGFAMSIPWSTAATSILLGVWFVSYLGTFDPAALRRAIASPAGGLPVALFGVALIGMLWADVAWAERLDGLKDFANLFAITLLISQFGSSPRGHWVLNGLLASITFLLILSYFHWIWPDLLPFVAPWPPGVPLKDHLGQNTLFSVAAFILLGQAARSMTAGRHLHAAGTILLAAAFLADILFVTAGRTGLVVIAVLLGVFCLRHANPKGTVAICIAAALLAVLAWGASPTLRERVGTAIEEMRNYQAFNENGSLSQRLEYWRTSVRILSESPVIGGGTGSIEDSFQRAIARGYSNLSEPMSNPHNQILSVALQLGVVGAALLLAMWAVHLLQFAGSSFLEWAGLVVVVQNIVSSLFNSHLFDFTSGWLYIVMVGVLAGMVQRQRTDLKLRYNSGATLDRCDNEIPAAGHKSLRGAGLSQR